MILAAHALGKDESVCGGACCTGGIPQQALPSSLLRKLPFVACESIDVADFKIKLFERPFN